MTGATIVYTNLPTKILEALPRSEEEAVSLYDLEKQLGVPFNRLQVTVNGMARNGYIQVVRLRRLHKPRVKYWVSED